VTSRGERAKLGATVAAIALVMGVLGALLSAIGGWLRLVGFVLLALGIVGVGQGVAIALGYLTPRESEDSEDRDARGN
jgi:hypothetical protein